jgi:hypothetical protein
LQWQLNMIHGWKIAPNEPNAIKKIVVQSNYVSLNYDEITNLDYQFDMYVYVVRGWKRVPIFDFRMCGWRL